MLKKIYEFEGMIEEHSFQDAYSAIDEIQRMVNEMPEYKNYLLLKMHWKELR